MKKGLRVQERVQIGLHTNGFRVLDSVPRVGMQIVAGPR